MKPSNRYQILLSLVLFIFLSFQSWGQTEIKIGGIVFPSFTTSERNQIVATDGQCIYNLSTDQLECYNGSQWKASSTTIVQHPWSVSNSGYVYVPSNTRVGVGTSAPSASFQIDSPADVDPFRARVQSSTKLRVHTNGSVSVGTSSAGPENGLHVNGMVGIGTTTPGARMTSADPNWQFQLLNNDVGGGSWYLGSSADAWAAGGGKFILSNTTSSTNAALVVDNSNNVGISNLSPSTKLHVSGGSDVNAVSGGYVTLGSNTSTHLAMDNNEIMARNNGSVSVLNLNAEGGEVRVNSGGGVRDEDALRVTGRVNFNNGGRSGMRITATDRSPTDALFEPTVFEEGLVGSSNRPFWRMYSREFYAQSALEYRTYSDRSLKGNILPINSALTKITNLEGVSYQLLKSPMGSRKRQLSKEEKFVEENQLGFIAQDVAKVLPQLVTKDESSGLYTVAYMGVIPVLVEAIKEQQSIIELQEIKLQALLKEKEVTANSNLNLDKRLRAIEAQLSQSNAMKSGTN